MEPPISAIMMESLRFIPPLSDSENAFCFSSRLNVDSIRSISRKHIFRGIPFTWKEEPEFTGRFQVYYTQGHFPSIFLTSSSPLCLCLCLKEKSSQIFELSKNNDFDGSYFILNTWIGWGWGEKNISLAYHAIEIKMFWYCQVIKQQVLLGAQAQTFPDLDHLPWDVISINIGLSTGSRIETYGQAEDITDT